MLALKKKREAEKKEREEEAARNAASGAVGPAAAPPGGQVSLFGIGGQKKTKKGEALGTRKSPGEIRIQKGNFSIRTEFPFPSQVPSTRQGGSH
jgi:hypothetical protein